MIKYIRVSNCGVSVTLGVKEVLVEQILQHCKEFYDYQEIDSYFGNEWLITSEHFLNEFDEDVCRITQCYEKLDEPKRKFLVSKARKILQVKEPTEERWLPQMLIRLTRDALRNLAYCNMYFLHGAFVVYKGHGICILGNKRCGKTTTVLNILSSDDTVFISNDDVSIAYNGEKWEGYGWPRSLSIRKDSFTALQKIGITFDWKVELNHPYNFNNVSEEYVTFYPSDFSRFVHSPILKSFCLDAVLFTSFTNENRFVCLDKQTGEKRLKEFIEQDINDYFGELGNYFMDKNDNRFSFGGGNIKYFDLRQNFSGLVKISELLDRYLQNESN